MKIVITSVLYFFMISISIAQNESLNQKAWRANILSPGVEYEHPVFKKSTISAGIGMTYSFEYRYTSVNGPEWFYWIYPYLDLQYKWFFNLQKRLDTGKNILYNSGNFLGIRVGSTGDEILSYSNEFKKWNFSITPMWGIQRAWGKVHFRFNVGPSYIVELNGENYFSFLNFELGLGLNFN